MKQNLGELTQSGAHTYKDKRGRTLIVNRAKKVAYVVDHENEKKYYVFSNRYILGIIAAIIIGYFNVWVGVAAGVVVLAALEFLYQKKFIPSLEEIELKELPEKYSLAKNINAQPRSKNLIATILGLIIPVLLVINLFTTIKDWNAVWSFKDLNGLLLFVVSIGVGLGILYLDYFTLTAFIRQSKEK